MRQNIDQHRFGRARLDQFLALLLGPGTLHEGHISASIQRGLEPLYAFVEGFLPSFRATELISLPGVGASNDQKVGVGPGFDGAANPLEVDLQVNDVLTLELAASLGEDLVFNVQTSDSGVLVQSDRTTDVERPAEPSVCVGDHWEIAVLHDHACNVRELGLRHYR